MSATQEAAAATETPGPASTETPAPESAGASEQSSAPKGEETRVEATGPEAALARAQEKIAKRKQEEENSAAPAAGEQAPDKTGESTQSKAGEEEEVDKSGKPAAGSEEEESALSTESTVSAPEDWPKEIQERFGALPNDDARQQVVDLYKPMHQAFTQITSERAQERKDNAELFQLQERFNSGAEGAKTVIQEIAEQAGIKEVYFEKPLPAGEIPDFENPADLVNFAVKQATENLRKENADRQTDEDRATSEKEAHETLKKELTQAATDHEDFADRRNQVVELLTETPGLTVEQAYRLSVWDGLVEMGQQAETLKTDLATANSEIDKLKAGITTPLPGNKTGEEDPPEWKNLSAAERAHKRAQRKIQQKNAVAA